MASVVGMALARYNASANGCAIRLPGAAAWAKNIAPAATNARPRRAGHPPAKRPTCRMTTRYATAGSKAPATSMSDQASSLMPGRLRLELCPVPVFGHRLVPEQLNADPVREPEREHRG